MCTPDTHKRRPGIRHNHFYIGKVRIYKTRRRNQSGNPLNALSENIIGHLKSINHGRVFIGDTQQSIIGNYYLGVDLLSEFLNSGICLDSTPPTFKHERSSNDTNR